MGIPSHVVFHLAGGKFRLIWLIVSVAIAAIAGVIGFLISFETDEMTFGSLQFMLILVVLLGSVFNFSSSLLEWLTRRFGERTEVSPTEYWQSFRRDTIEFAAAQLAAVRTSMEANAYQKLRRSVPAKQQLALAAAMILSMILWLATFLTAIGLIFDDAPKFVLSCAVVVVFIAAVSATRLAQETHKRVKWTMIESVSKLRRPSVRG